jgi:hypothetical protein
MADRALLYFAAVQTQKRLDHRCDLASELVGDTGFEPVTSSVSRNDRRPVTCSVVCRYLRKQSFCVHQRPSWYALVVTQFVTHPESADDAPHALGGATEAEPVEVRTWRHRPLHCRRSSVSDIRWHNAYPGALATGA